MTLRVKDRAGAASRQPRADQPGAGQSGRERDQIRQAGRRWCSRWSAGATAARAKEILIEARREGDPVLLSVTDHGPGIPEGDRKHAVERFVRLEASRTLPGSGLGLSLASAVATLHGGELRLGDAHPGPERDAGDPGAGRRERQACGSNAGCATEGGMNSSAHGTTRTDIVWPRGSWPGRMLSAPDQSRTATGRLARRTRAGAVGCDRRSAARFPRARAILLGHRGSLALSVRSDPRRRRAR